MIKTYSDGSQGFDLSDLSRPENTEFIKNTIKNSNARFRNSFISQTLDLRNAYINKLNSIACGNPVRPVPWNESTDENEIREILKTHPEYELDYNLELYEEKMLAMGLDPTEGMFKQFPPGMPVLSSGRGKHISYMEQVKDEEGLNTPELANFLIGVSDQNDPEITKKVEEDNTDYAQYGYNNYMANQYMMTSMIGQPPIYPGIYGPNLNRENLAVMVEVPIRQYGYIEPPRDISREMQDESIPYETRMQIYNDTVRYTNEYNEYMKGAWYEVNKQNIYNQIRELVDQRSVLVNSPVWYMQPQVRASWEKDIQKLDVKIAELQQNIPNYTQDRFWQQEQQMLEYNYQAKKYNDNKIKYDQYRYEQSINNRPGTPQFVTADDLYKQGCWFNPNTKEWFDQYGRNLNRQKAAIEDEKSRAKYIYENEVEINNRRNQLLENALMYNNMIRDVMRSQGYGEEEIQRVIDSDPFRLDYNLNYNPAYQSASTWNSYMGRMYPSYEKIDPETGKNVDELTAEELENYTQRMQLRARNNQAASAILLTPEQLMAMKLGGGAMANGSMRMWTMRAPLTTKLQELNDNYDGKPKGIHHIFDTMSQAMPAYEYAIKHHRPRDLSGFYNHKDFDDCIENFVHKTRIGRTSDLLNEIDNNQEFAKAMNDGILGLSLPEEIGFNYNKRRVEYDNSILEQLQKVNKPLPEGAKIKDYHTETYNGKSIKEIQKEQYGKALERAAKLKSYFSPDLGGTWDAATVNNN